MHTPINEKTMRITDIVGQNLALRYSADKLFDHIDSLRSISIIIDFYGVRTTSRSFMQQFLYRLEINDDRDIKYINMSENIREMFEIVKTPKKKPTIVNPKPRRVIHLASSIFVHNDEDGSFSMQKRGASSLVPLESSEMHFLALREENVFKKR